MNIQFVLGETTMRGHLSEVGVGNYKMAHIHGDGAHIVQLGDEGYSLYWREGEEPRRVDWKFGMLHSPGNDEWHQHFNVSDRPGRYLPLGYGGYRYPFTTPIVQTSSTRTPRSAISRSSTRTRILRFASCSKRSAASGRRSTASRGHDGDGPIGRLDRRPRSMTAATAVVPAGRRRSRLAGSSRRSCRSQLSSPYRLVGAAARLGLISSFFFSSPSAIVAAGAGTSSSPILERRAVSTQEFVVGYVAAVVLAVPFGLLTGWFRTPHYLFEPWLAASTRRPAWPSCRWSSCGWASASRRRP